MIDPTLNSDRCLLFHQGNNGHAVVLLPGLCGSELEMGAIPRLLKQSGYSYAIPQVKGFVGNYLTLIINCNHVI